MTARRLKRPRDQAQLAKLIVDIATGEVDDRVEDGKDPAAVNLGRQGGLKGGNARAAKSLPSNDRKRHEKRSGRVGRSYKTNHNVGRPGGPLMLFRS